MTKLEIVDRFDNADLGTFTLVLRDQDNPNDVGAMYHYAADPPAHANLSAEDWAKQAAGHALHLEARSRGVELPEDASRDAALAQPAEASSAAPAVALAPDEAAELDELRADQVELDQAARDRAELEQLRAERAGAGPEQPTA